jgi:hypothetical protein
MERVSHDLTISPDIIPGEDYYGRLHQTTSAYELFIYKNGETLFTLNGEGCKGSIRVENRKEAEIIVRRFNQNPANGLC